MLNEDIKRAQITGFWGNHEPHKLPFYHSLQITLDGKLYELKPSNPESTMVLKRCKQFKITR